MYYALKDIKEFEFGTDQEWINYCEEVFATSYSTAYETYIQNDDEHLKEAGLYTYVFTIDDEQTAKLCFNRGADII